MNTTDRNAPEHEDVAVGEVDELDDPVDHRVAEGDEGVDRADREGVDGLLEGLREGVLDGPPAEGEQDSRHSTSR